MEYTINQPLPSRRAYADSIESFIEKEYVKRAEVRKNRFLSKDKEKLRAEYVDMLGFPLNEYEAFSPISVSCRWEPVFSGKDTEIYRLHFTMPGGILFTGLFFRAMGAEENALLFALHGMKGAPEVICAEGTLSDNYNAFVRRALRPGLCIFAPQLLLWNTERFGDPYNRTEINDKLRQLGGSIAALELFCLRCAADYLGDLDYIDADRMGVAGLSYGGMYALALGAADTRMKVTLCSGYFNDRTKYLYDWTYRAQASVALDAEQAMLIADRKLYVELGEADATFSVDSARKELERVKEYAAAGGDPSFLRVKIHPGVHAFDLSDEGVHFLWKHLLGQEYSSPIE